MFNCLKSQFINLTPDTRYYKCPNPIIALTGGISTGKSTASDFLKDYNLCVISADSLIHEIYSKQETKNFIQNLCPSTIENNTIDFKELRRIFFSDHDIKNQIEHFLYKRLPAAFQQKLPQNKLETVIYDIPLLFEKKLESHFDQVIMITTEESIQKERLIKRDGLDLNTHQNILSSQLSLQEKCSRSNFIIYNNGTKEDLKAQISDLYHKLFCEKR